MVNCICVLPGQLLAFVVPKLGLCAWTGTCAVSYVGYVCVLRGQLLALVVS